MYSHEFHSEKYKAKLYQEWLNFQNHGKVDRGIVRDFIYNSWVRCKEYQEKYGELKTQYISPKELENTKKENTLLLDSATNIMDKMFSALDASQSTMSLISKEGVVLKILTTAKIDYTIGSIALEKNIGTTGMGTCLEEKRPIEIFAAEHSSPFYHHYVCSSAPIMDKANVLQGVLCISSHWDTFHPHTSGLVLTAVHAISEQLRLRELLVEQKLLLELQDAGVLVVDEDDYITSINQKAMGLLGISVDPSSANLKSILSFVPRIEERLSKRKLIQDEESTIQMQNGNVHSCVITITPNSATKGAIITLREASRMRDFANKITGANAKYVFEDILGTSKPISDAVEQARRAAASEVTSLILGESGTGKELFAQAIHNASPRKDKPFIVVNCGALPRDLVQSELFGYSEGAFTGASKQGKAGKFELADKGTIFLDEIGEMPLEAQTSLLRLLQNGEVARVGGHRVRHVDVRVIAATNRNLLQAIKDGVFREDLYYRLNVFTLVVPSLRDRGSSDIELLAEFFLKKFRASLGNSKKILADSTLSALKRYKWPGNVRELENTMERAVYMSIENTVQLHDLPANLIESLAQSQNNFIEKIASKENEDNRLSNFVNTQSPNLQEQPADFLDEKSLLIQTLAKHRGHIGKSAAELAMARSTIYYKLKTYGLDSNQFRLKNFVHNQQSLNPSYQAAQNLPGLSASQEELLLQIIRLVKTMN